MKHGGQPLKPDVDAARRKAYQECANDLEAAKRLGMELASFSAWRRVRGLVTKRPPGQMTHMTQRQDQILAFLEAHPWSGLYDVSRGLGLHSWTTLGSIRCLEIKKLVDVCSLNRAKKYARVGTPPPKYGMALERGAASLYHAGRLPVRIPELLRKEPWLTGSMVARRLKGTATKKAVEGAMLELHHSGRLQRKEIDTPMRRMNVYALVGSPSLRGPHVLRVHKEIQEISGFWRSQDDVLNSLKRRPWQTVPEIMKSAGVKRSQVYCALQGLRDRDKVTRVRISEANQGKGRGAQFRWAPTGADPRAPGGVINVVDDPGPQDDARSRVLLLVQERPKVTATELTAAYRRRWRLVGYEYICGLLKDLEEAGAITSLGHRGSKPGRWVPNGAAGEALYRTARRHYEAMELQARRLRDLGFEVKVDLAPPPWVMGEMEFKPMEVKGDAGDEAGTQGKG